MSFLYIVARIQSNNEWLAHCSHLHHEENVRIGKMARIEREKVGLSLRELARRIGVSAAFLSDFELGRRSMSKTTLTKWLEECSK
jgi:DNA-binding transcriptional regulator YiaG